MKWIEETDVLEMIVDKFSSSVSSFLGNLFLPQECLYDLSNGDSFFLWNSHNFSVLLVSLRMSHFPFTPLLLVVSILLISVPWWTFSFTNNNQKDIIIKSLFSFYLLLCFLDRIFPFIMNIQIQNLNHIHLESFLISNKTKSLRSFLIFQITSFKIIYYLFYFLNFLIFAWWILLSTMFQLSTLGSRIW